MKVGTQGRWRTSGAALVDTGCTHPRTVKSTSRGVRPIEPMASIVVLQPYLFVGGPRAPPERSQRASASSRSGQSTVALYGIA